MLALSHDHRVMRRDRGWFFVPIVQLGHTLPVGLLDLAKYVHCGCNLKFGLGCILRRIVTTVEPLNKDTFRTCRFVRCPLSEVIFYRVCIQEYCWLVLCWEVCPFSECPLFRGFTVPRFVCFGNRIDSEST